ncbi:HTH-type transcriptional regulator Xre [Candidatus Izimaplasma bacterium HR1]|uniref:helix-turn-helix domain-containing protein n=1 Tax=Candidatus Izimoplasma sp. HR1 TaxID=1541959 RepID=UPI0004F6FD23|nr:HTH-type transcriptional regulator Xre [Candidatus Izimaplasma bacterium HR1]
MIAKTGNRISSLRKNRNLSQEDLAELLNVSRQTISKWENQEVLPDAYNLIGLSKIFRVSIDELLLGKTHSMYSSTNLMSEMKQKRDKFNLYGRIFAIVASILFIVPLIILESIGIPDPPMGIIAAGLVSLFGILFAIAVTFFVKSYNFSNEYKYLERLEFEKSGNNQDKEE